MPGIPPPYRSRKLFSFSNEWIGYRDDYGLIGIPIGLLLVAVGCGLPFISFYGIFVKNADWNLKTIVGSIMAFGLCLLFAAIGFRMLVWNRTWLNVNHANRAVWKVGGIFGIDRRSFKVNDILGLKVCRTKDPWIMFTAPYAVVLSNYSEESIEIGHAATYELARDMCREINLVLGTSSI